MSLSPDPSCGLVLLAAGASTRMGQPKQLLPVAGKPLLRHVVESALASPAAPVVVVLGANAATVASALAGLAVHVVVNEAWAEGMASSLRRGIEALTATAPTIDAAIIALADQPDFSAAHVGQLVETHRRTGRTIVASDYQGVLMPPALFAARHFPELRALRGDAGARTLFQAHPDCIARVPIDQARDLDTPEDYQRYLRK